MSLLLVGISHHTAQVALREQFAVPADRLVEVDRALASCDAVDEALVLATCNRTELLAVSERPERARDELVRFLREEIGRGTPVDAYVLLDDDAVQHLYRVCASLDAMVVGEAQILGQAKAAYRSAVDAASCGPVLNRLLQGSFHAAKRVRTETGLGASSVSVARIGVQLAGELFETFENKRVVLVGAGEMAESALHGLREAGARDLVVVNRTVERAQGLALRVGGRAAALDSLARELRDASIALVSAAAGQPLISPALLPDERPGEPLLLIDLALPRGVDPALAERADVYLYDLDDLDAVAARGLVERAGSVPAAEAIVAEECARFLRWCATLEAVPTIQALQRRVEGLARDELRRTLGKVGPLPPELEAALERMLAAFASKLLHPALRAMRSEAEEKAAPYYTDAVRRIFGLEEEDR